MKGIVRVNVSYSSGILPDNLRGGLSMSSCNKGFLEQTVLILEWIGIRRDERNRSSKSFVNKKGRVRTLPFLSLFQEAQHRSSL